LAENAVMGEGAKVIAHARGLKGAFRPPGDLKTSLANLAVAALAEGDSILRGLSPLEEITSLLHLLRRFGLPVVLGPEQDTVRLKGGTASMLIGDEPEEAFYGGSWDLFCTLVGLFAGSDRDGRLIGDRSFPPERLVSLEKTLRRMGAQVESDDEDRLALVLQPHGLVGISHTEEIVDDGLKGALLLAGLRASGSMTIEEPTRSHDQFERALKRFGAGISTRAVGGGRGAYTVALDPAIPLKGAEVDIPGDPSLALFLVVAALLMPRSELLIQGINLNPSRREALNVLNRMGGRIELKDRRMVNGETVGDVSVRHSKLKGTGIAESSIPFLEEDIPILAVAAAFAEGESFFKGAEFLRHGPVDRIRAIVDNLRTLGIEVGEYPDGLVLRGKVSNDGVEFNAFGDAGIAMAFHVAALACQGESVIHGYEEAVSARWSSFPQILEALHIG
jgi:3-phosphoshikimate 1-carboxyvinyltransferase